MEKDDSFRNYGFLSNEEPLPKPSSMPQAAPVFQEIRDYVNTALDTLHSSLSLQLDMSEDDRSGWWMGTAFWARSIESCQGAVILADRGMSGSAVAVLRTALECLIYAAALWRHPSMWERIHETQQEEQRKQVNGMQLKPFPDSSPEFLADLHSLQAAEKANTWSVFEAATKADLESLYEAGYRGLGFVGAHATALSAERFFVDHPDHGPVLYVGPNYTDFEFIVRTVGICLDIGIKRFQEQATAHAPPPNPR